MHQALFYYGLIVMARSRLAHFQKIIALLQPNIAILWLIYL